MGAPSPKPISVFFEVLPTSIQAIIPPIPSFRRSVSQRSMKVTSFFPGALFVLQPQTPTPSEDGIYGDGEADRHSTEDVELVVEDEMDRNPMRRRTRTLNPRTIVTYPTSGSASGSSSSSGRRQEEPIREVIELPAGTRPTPPPSTLAEKKTNFQFLRLPRRRSSPAPPPLAPQSGIDRKFQKRGGALLRDSEAESDPTNTNPNPAFERRAYLDGVAYLLKGLPRDLDEAEVSIIRCSLPTPLRNEFGPHHPGPAAGVAGAAYIGGGGGFRGAGGGIGGIGGIGGGPSPVRRTVQTAMTALIFLLRLLVSVLITAAQELMRVGQEYQIPERVFGQTMFVASSFASMGTSAAGTIGSLSKASYALVDDRVGNGLGSILQWFADEAIAGVCDGVRDGLRYQGYAEGQ